MQLGETVGVEDVEVESDRSYLLPTNKLIDKFFTTC